MVRTGVREDMEDHSGVADRTVLSVDSAVARVKGKHHDGDVLSWTVYYAVKSGGTANLFVLCGWKGFFNIKNTAAKPHHHTYKR